MESTLADRLTPQLGTGPVVVLGLGHGGVAVAEPVAAALHAPLDVLLVRSLRLPGRHRPPLVAVTGAGMRLQVERPVAVPDARAARDFDDAWVAQIRELAIAEDAVREGLPRLELRDRVVVVVAEDLGACPDEVVAAVSAVRRRRPARIVVAAPSGPLLVRARLGHGEERAADAVVRLRRDWRLWGASRSAQSQRLLDPAPSGEEVRQLLADARGRARTTTRPALLALGAAADR